VTEELRECPMCGEAMRKHQREVVIRIPGTTEVKKHVVHDWVCTESDYFEEVGLRGDEEPRS
jgi:C4-type Zn-finger protein